jgi:hypothetical protein
MNIKKKISSAGKIFVFYGVFFLLSQCFIAYSAQPQDKLKNIKELWENEKYKEAAEELAEYRKGLYKKNATVDYMLATCYCRIQETKNAGYKGFRWILRNYNLDRKSKNLVKKEMRECSPSNKPIRIIFLVQHQTDGGSVGGKVFYLIQEDFQRRGEEFWDVAISSRPASVIEEISEEEFESRLFKVEEKDVAVETINKQLESKFGAEKFKVESVGPFLLASSSGHSANGLQRIGQTLKKFLDFYKSQYDFPSLPNFTTVYMAPDAYEMRRIAEKLHGISVSEACIGYWFKSDLSVVGAIPGMQIGTLAHELFHLMVRSNFGDIPPWLDEGMAALYEVSEIEDGQVRGIPNWRGLILREFWGMQPSIEKLVQMDWDSFNNAEENFSIERQAANHAAARYFILYLQEKQKLREVFKAFRDRRFEDMEEDEGTDAVKLLESILNKTISEINRDFERFFKSLDH